LGVVRLPPQDQRGKKKIIIKINRGFGSVTPLLLSFFKIIKKLKLKFLKLLIFLKFLLFSVFKFFNAYDTCRSVDVNFHKFLDGSLDRGLTINEVPSTIRNKPQKAKNKDVKSHGKKIKTYLSLI
jgi:hypothetical protein